MQAATGDLWRVNAAFRRHLPHRWRHRHFTRLRLLGTSADWPRSRGFLVGRACRADRRLSRPSTSTFLDLTEQSTDGNRFTVFHRDVGEYAIGRRRHFQRYFVGFELDQWLVDHHRIPLLLEPFANRRFGHRFAQGGYADVSHGLLPQFCTVILRASEPSLEGLRFLCSSS